MNTELIALADTLNNARIAANENETTAPQTGVYGHISRALVETLTLLFNGRANDADMAYDALIAGGTTTEAIEFVAKARHEQGCYKAEQSGAALALAEIDGGYTKPRTWEPVQHTYSHMVADGMSRIEAIDHAQDFIRAYTAEYENIFGRQTSQTV